MTIYDLLSKLTEEEYQLLKDAFEDGGLEIALREE